MASNLVAQGVTGASASDGLTTLANKILDIQTGGSCYHIEFIEDSYVTYTGSIVVHLYLQENYAPKSNAVITITGGASSVTATTDSNGIATATVGINQDTTLAATYSNASVTAGVTYLPLPAEYTAIEFLQSNASASAKVGINTEYILKADDIVEITYSSQANAQYESVFGARKTNNDYNSYVFFCRFNSSNKSVYGRTRQEKQGNAISLNTKYKVITNQGACYVYDDSGTLLDTITNTGTIEDCVNPCSLFTLNTAGGTGYSKDTASHMKIYEFKIKDSNGDYKRYMIPVRDTNSNGGMYDFITEQFYTDPDGRSFTLGNDI